MVFSTLQKLDSYLLVGRALNTDCEVLNDEVSRLGQKLIEELAALPCIYDHQPDRWKYWMMQVRENLARVPSPTRSELEQRISCWLNVQLKRDIEDAIRSIDEPSSFGELCIEYLSFDVLSPLRAKIKEVLEPLERMDHFEEVLYALAVSPICWHDTLLENFRREFVGEEELVHEVEKAQYIAFHMSHYLRFYHHSKNTNDLLAQCAFLRHVFSVGTLPAGDPEKVELEKSMVNLGIREFAKEEENCAQKFFSSLIRVVACTLDDNAPFGIVEKLNGAERACARFSDHSKRKEVRLAFLMTPSSLFGRLRKLIDEGKPPLDFRQVFQFIAKAGDRNQELLLEHWEALLDDGDWLKLKHPARIMRILAHTFGLSFDHPFMEKVLHFLPFEKPLKIRKNFLF